MSALIITLLTTVIWYKIPWQSFMSEGFYYFSHTFFYDPRASYTIVESLLRYDTGARLLFDVLPLFFQDKIWLYFLLLFLVIIIINGLYHQFIWELTRDRVVSLMATVFFIANFSAAYDILATGSYQFFAQRIVLFPILFLSLIALAKKRFWLSAGLYLTAFILGQFSLYFLPLIIFYIAFDWIKNKKSFSFLFKTLPYLIGVGLLLYLDHQDYGAAFEMTFPPRDFWANIAYQFPWAMLPYPLLKVITKEPHVRQNLIRLFFPLFALTLLTIFYFFCKRLRHRFALAMMALFLLATLGLNAYVRPDNIFRIYGSGGSRYLYVPSLATAAFWAILLCAALPSKKPVGKFLLVLITSWWLISNTQVIWARINDSLAQHQAVKQMLVYFKNHSAEFDNKLVIIPNLVGYNGGDFIQKFYNPSAVFLPMAADWEKQITYTFPPEKLLVFTYDEESKRLQESSAPFHEMIKNKQAITEEIKQSF